MPQFFRIFLNRFKEYLILVFLLVLSLILITLNDNYKVRNIRVYTLGIFAGVNSVITNIGRVFEDSEYIESLEKRNAELMLQVNQLRNFGLENNELNKILNFRSDTEYDFVAAKIVSRLVSKVSGYFIISKGFKDGVENGMPVITDDGLVGLVLDAADNYSTVRTYENSLFSVAVKDQRSNIDGLLNWDGRNLLIKNVPTTYDIELGDRIVVSELSSIIPPKIPVGIVVEKETTLSGVLSNLRVQPFVKLSNIKNVMVLKINRESQLDSLSLKLLGSGK